MLGQHLRRFLHVLKARIVATVTHCSLYPNPISDAPLRRPSSAPPPPSSAVTGPLRPGRRLHLPDRNACSAGRGSSSPPLGAPSHAGRSAVLPPQRARAPACCSIGSTRRLQASGGWRCRLLVLLLCRSSVPANSAGCARTMGSTNARCWLDRPRSSCRSLYDMGGCANARLLGLSRPILAGCEPDSFR